MKVILNRVLSNSTTTVGMLTIQSVPNSVLTDYRTLEPAYLNNQKIVSCIPPGRYVCTKRYSNKFKWHYEVLDVPNRNLILIHVGNFRNDTKGCILIGSSLNFNIIDNEVMIQQSKRAMIDFMEKAGQTFTLEIINNL